MGVVVAMLTGLLGSRQDCCERCTRCRPEQLEQLMTVEYEIVASFPTSGQGRWPLVLWRSMTCNKVASSRASCLWSCKLCGSGWARASIEHGAR